MKSRSAVIYQVLMTLKVLVNHLSAVKEFEDFGTDVCRSANGWSVAEDFCRFFDRLNHFSLP